MVSLDAFPRRKNQSDSNFRILGIVVAVELMADIIKLSQKILVSVQKSGVGVKVKLA
jgi:hypothetical protein